MHNTNTAAALAHADLRFAQKTILVVLAYAGRVLDSRKLDAAELAYSAGLYRDYTKRAAPAGAKASASFKRGKGKPTKAELRKIIGALSKAIGSLSAKERKYIDRNIAEIYALSRAETEKKMAKVIRREVVGKAKKDKPTRTVLGVAFTQVDEDAVDALSKNQTYWVGKNFGEDLQSAMMTGAEEKILREGLGRAEAGPVFDDLLRKNLGFEVPIQYKGTAQSYFAGMAGLARVQSASFAATTTFRQVGVQTYKISAAMDERTCPECAFMDGKEFSTTHATEHVDRIGNAKTPDAVKNVNRWMKLPAMMSHAGITKPTQSITPKGTASMAEAGLALPPYHFKCRCTVEPSTYESWAERGFEAQEMGKPITMNVPPFPGYPKSFLREGTNKQLRDMAKRHNIKYFRVMNKEELITVLNDPGQATRIAEIARARWLKKPGAPIGPPKPPVPAQVSIAEKRAQLEKLTTKELMEKAQSAGISNFRVMRKSELVEVLADPTQNNKLQRAVRARVNAARGKPGKVPGATKADDLGLTNAADEHAREINILVKRVKSTMSPRMTNQLGGNNAARKTVKKWLEPLPTNILRELNRRGATIEFRDWAKNVSWRGKHKNFWGISTGKNPNNLKMAVVGEGYYAPNRLRNTFYHELGHLIDYSHDVAKEISGYGARPKLLGMKKLVKESWTSQTKRAFATGKPKPFVVGGGYRDVFWWEQWKTTEGLPRQISAYSNHSPEEFFAEAIANYTKGGRKLEQLYPGLYSKIKKDVFNGYEFRR